jgi:hypothetical protein
MSSPVATQLRTLLDQRIRARMTRSTRAKVDRSRGLLPYPDRRMVRAHNTDSWL